MARDKIILSAALKCYVNGQPYGRIRSFSYQANTPHTPIHCIDVMEPLELAATTTSISGNLEIYRTAADAGAEGAGMAARGEDLSRAKYFNLTIVDSINDTVVFEARYCSVQSQNWSMPERGYVSGQLSFSAINWSNELRPRMP